MKVPMPLPLPLMVPAAYYYYNHQHLLHSSSYLSYNSCLAMPKCAAGTWVRPRVCNPTALTKAWACKASPVAFQWCAEPAGTGACIRPHPRAVAAMLVAAAACSCYWKSASGAGSPLADMSELDCTALCGRHEWWGKVYGYPHLTLWCLEDKHSPKLLPVNIHATCSSKKRLCSPVLFSPPAPPHSLCLQGGVSIEGLWTGNPCRSPYSDWDLSVDKVTVRNWNNLLGSFSDGTFFVAEIHQWQWFRVLVTLKTLSL